MKVQDRDYEEALAYLRAQLSKPDAEVDRWLNGIVDSWVARRHARRVRKRHE